MCSFMVYTDSDISMEEFKKGFKKGLKISWKIIEVVGVIGGVMFLGYAGRSIYESHKKKGSN